MNIRVFNRATTRSVARPSRRAQTRSRAPDDNGPTEERMVPFSQLMLYYSEIGVHRGRKHGFGAVFGYRTLRGVMFTSLARRVRDAFEGKKVPSHKGWPAQRDQMKWFVEQGRDALIAMGEAKVWPAFNDRFYISDGHHRALALFILGDSELRVKVKRGP